MTFPVETGFWAGSLAYSPVYAPGGITLDIGGAPDANGVRWTWQEIAGWDSPDVAGQVIQKAADHGGWPASQFLAPRIITVTIMAEAPTQALRDAARAALQQVLAIGVTPNDLTALSYFEPVPKTCLVRRSGKITESKPDLTSVIFTCNLVAPDPRKYGLTVNSQTSYASASSGGGGMIVPFTVPFTLDAGTPPGVMTVLNAGNFETRPTLTVRGPLTAPTVANATYGQTISFSSLALGATDVLTVDLLNQVAYLNGSLRNADLSSAWWVLWPGSNVIELGSQASGSGASITAQWQDGWL